MSESARSRPERRAHQRITPKGSAVVSANGDSRSGRIANLGRGGAFVSTRMSAPERMLARPVRVELRLDARIAEWVVVTGHVVRIQADGIAIAFDEPSDRLLALIDVATTASHAHSRVIAVVLIDHDEARRTAMATGFRATGCNVVEAATPLEAIVRLGETSFEPDVIAVGDTPTDVGAELRAFVEREHPAAKLVHIGDDQAERDGIPHWLSSSDPLADLSARVRVVLAQHRMRR